MEKELERPSPEQSGSYQSLYPSKDPIKGLKRGDFLRKLGPYSDHAGSIVKVHRVGSMNIPGSNQTDTIDFTHLVHLSEGFYVERAEDSHNWERYSE